MKNTHISKFINKYLPEGVSSKNVYPRYLSSLEIFYNFVFKTETCQKNNIQDDLVYILPVLF